MNKTGIEWCDYTWNPITGCTPISEGCKNCYAKTMAHRLKGRCGYPADDPFRVIFHPEKLDEPARVKKPSRIFVCSMGDLFHEDVETEWINAIFEKMVNAQWIYGHTFILLTKRPERMMQIVNAIGDELREQGKTGMTFQFPLRNIWLGVTAENQRTTDERIPILLQIPAVVRFVSCEPLLEPVDLSRWLQPEWYGMPMPAPEWMGRGKNGTVTSVRLRPRLDWVICGGETGLKARACNPEWISHIWEQCCDEAVPFFFKQWGLATYSLSTLPWTYGKADKCKAAESTSQFPEVRS